MVVINLLNRATPLGSVLFPSSVITSDFLKPPYKPGVLKLALSGQTGVGNQEEHKLGVLSTPCYKYLKNMDSGLDKVQRAE